MSVKNPLIINPGKPGMPITECIRCGICCKKGGPSFHLEDKALIEKGVILLKYLYTIRKGEPARDNVKGGIKPVTSDIIKIRGKEDSWTCVFFEEKEKTCIIYENRPVECRLLKCWDTRDIEQIYEKNRLTRKDLLREVKGLLELVEDHERRCSYDNLRKLADALKAGKQKSAKEEILDMIKYDASLRQVVVEKRGLEPEMMDFLFGRPLTMTIKMFSLKVKLEGQRSRAGEQQLQLTIQPLAPDPGT